MTAADAFDAGQVSAEALQLFGSQATVIFSTLGAKFAHGCTLMDTASADVSALRK